MKPLLRLAKAYDAILFAIFVGGLFALLAYTGGIAVRPARAGDSIWTPVTPLPEGLGHAPAVTYQDRIYLAGGEGPSGNIRSSVVYATVLSDGSLTGWQTTTPLPEPRHYHAMVEANGYLYVIGGASTTSTPKGTIFYAKINDDGSVGSWSTSFMPVIRFGASAASYGGRIYVTGGSDASTMQDTVYHARSRPSDGNLEWSSSSATTPLPTPLGWTSAVAVDGHLYVAGGFDGSQRRDTVFRAPVNSDGTLGSWVSESSLPAPLANHVVVEDGGYLYAVGGLGSADFSESAAMAAPIQADGSLGAWSLETSMPRTLHDQAAVVSRWRMFVIGGYSTAYSAYQSNVYRYIPPRVHVKGVTCGTYIRGGSVDRFPYFLPDGSVEPWQVDPYISGIFHENESAEITGAYLFPYSGSGDGYQHYHTIYAYEQIQPVAGCGAIDGAELDAQAEYPTVSAGASVPIWINVRNSGTTTWRASDGYGWRGTGLREGQSGNIWQEVAPGGILNYAETIVVPQQAGVYTYGFILQHNGQDFGYHFFIQVTVTEAPQPSAEFDAWPQSGNAPLTVAMHIVSTSGITSCAWDYGDGQSGTSCDGYHNHLYSAAGSYTVRLTVTGPGGTASTTRNNYINVSTQSDFTVGEHGYRFVNLFAGTPFVSGQTVYDLFGDNACWRNIGPGCVLKSEAVKWANLRALETYNNGHCNGMSITSLRFYRGQEQPGAFQPFASRTHDLLFENLSVLQHITSYQIRWGIPEVTSRLRPYVDETMEQSIAGIERGFVDGNPRVMYIASDQLAHAVVPIRVEHRGGDEVHINVYDPNYPDDPLSEHTVIVHPQSGTWEYAYEPGDIWRYAWFSYPVSVFQGPFPQWEIQARRSNATLDATSAVLTVSPGITLRDGNGQLLHGLLIPAGNDGPSEKVYLLSPAQLNDLVVERTEIVGDRGTILYWGPGGLVAIEGLGAAPASDALAIDFNTGDLVFAPGTASTVDVTLSATDSSKDALITLQDMALSGQATMTATASTAQTSIAIDSENSTTYGLEMAVNSTSAINQQFVNSQVDITPGAIQMLGIPALIGTSIPVTTIDINTGQTTVTVLNNELATGGSLYLPNVVR